MPPLRPTRRALLAGGLGTLAARAAPSPAAAAAPGQALSPAVAVRADLRFVPDTPGTMSMGVPAVAEQPYQVDP